AAAAACRASHGARGGTTEAAALARGSDRVLTDATASAACIAHDADGADLAAAADGLIVGQGDAVEVDGPLVEGGAPRSEATATEAASVASLGQTVLQRQVLQRQGCRVEPAQSAADKEETQTVGRCGARTLACQGSAIALDGDIAVDGRQ